MHAEQGGTNLIRARFGKDDADTGVEFVDFTDGFDAQAVFGNARPVAQAGCAAVTRACDDLGEAITHSGLYTGWFES